MKEAAVYYPPKHLFVLWDKVRGRLVYEQGTLGRMVPMIFEKEDAAERYVANLPTRTDHDIILYTSNCRCL